MKALLIILNKNKALLLDKCLKSIVNQDGFCLLFDVLVIDGASKDNSREVAEKYKEKYGCIEFKVQKRLGGTGYARNEGCHYALKKGYDVIIWGDSENYYEKDYFKNILEKIRDRDVVGGVPKVIGKFYAHAFAWYHAIHLIFPGLYRMHIPGNNKAERVEIFKRFRYPNSLRSDDYGFSLLLRKNGVHLKHDISWNSIVRVSLPEKWRDVKTWQDFRAKGAAQALREVGVKPYDNIAWGIGFLLFIFFIILLPVNCIPLLIYFLLFFVASLFIFFKSIKYLVRPKYRYFFAPFFGLLVYSYYSLKTVFYYLSYRK